MERRLAEDFFATLRSEFEIVVAAESSDDISVVLECFWLLWEVCKHEGGQRAIGRSRGEGFSMPFLRLMCSAWEE